MTTITAPSPPTTAGQRTAAATIRRVRVPAWAVAATGSATNAVVLGQLVFWIHADAGRRAHKPSPERGILGAYVFKSARELAVETGLTPSRCTRAVTALRRRGFIATRRRKFRGAPTNAVWLTTTAMEQIRRHDADRRAVSVLPSVVARLEDVNAALLVSQLAYWFTRRDENGNTLAHAPRPRIGVSDPWIAKTDQQLADETGLSRHRVKRARALLIRQGLVRTHRCRFGDGTATRYQLHDDALTALIALPKAGEQA